MCLMLRISNLLTTSRYLPLTRLWLQVRSFCSPSPSSLSSSSSLSVPSDDHIVRLILDQKSASKALETFQWASNFPGFIHSRSTYRALFHKLCVFRRFETVYQLLDEMPGSIGLPPDDAIFITIIRGFGRARLIKRVINVVDLVSKFGIKPSLKVLNSILDVLVKEDIDIAREFFRRKMMATGIQGDEYTYGILMKGLCLTNRIADGFKLLQFMKTRGLAPNTVIYNTLLHALCKNEKVGRARSLMSEMKQPNDVTFNILISAYCNEQKLIQSMVLLEKCFNLGFVPDVVTITKVMEVLCNEGRVSEALEVLERVESSKGGKVDVVACNTLVKGYCKLGKVRVAQRFFKEMERKGYLPNVETYNLLIGGFCDVRMLDSALETFHDMKTDAVRWNFSTFNTLIKGLSVGGRVSDGLKILELMQESETVRGVRIDPYNIVIYGFYKENRWEEALEFLMKMEKMFPRAVERSFKLMNLCEEGDVDDVKTEYDEMIGEGGVSNVIVSHCLIHRYSQEEEDYMEETLKLINDMVTRGYLPQSSTFNAVIIGFCKKDRVVNGIKFVEDMAERGCVPDGESYKPLLQELCVKGDFEKAWLVFSRMVEKSIVPDSSMWSSLMFCLSQKTEFHINTSLEDIIQT